MRGISGRCQKSRAAKTENADTRQYRAPPFLVKCSQRIFMAIVQKRENPHQTNQGQADVGKIEICQPDRLVCFA